MVTPAVTPVVVTATKAAVVTPAAPVAAVASQTWLQKHTTLIIVFLALVLAVFLAQKYFSYVDGVDSKKQQVALAALATQKTATDQALSQDATTLKDYQTALNAEVTQNAQLSAAISSRNKVLVQQQATNATLAPTALATHWAADINKPSTEVVSNASGTTVTDDAAIATVNQLDSVPVLQANLQSTQAQVDDLNVQSGKASALILQGQTAVTDLKTELVDQTKSCTAQVNSLKAAARKSRLKTFAWGFGTGFVSGLFIGLKGL
jgi:hypothetical protein